MINFIWDDDVDVDVDDDIAEVSAHVNKFI